MTTSDRLHLSPEDKNWRKNTFETYQTLKETNVAAARAWLKEVLQSDMHQEIGDRKKEVRGNREKVLEEIRSFDEEEQALNSRRGRVDDLRRQLKSPEKITPELQEKLDTFNADHKRYIMEVQEQFKDRNEVNRERVWELYNDPKRMFTRINAQGDVEIVFPQCGPKGAKIKTPNFEKYGFTEDQKRVLTDKDFLSVTASKGSQTCLFKYALRSKEFTDMIDDAEKLGYRWDASKEDEIMYYIANEVGLSYDPKNLGNHQSMMEVKMALRKKLGWDFLNRDKNGNNGDKYGHINGKYNDNIQIANMDDQYQGLDGSGSYNIDASLTLVGDND